MRNSRLISEKLGAIRDPLRFLEGLFAHSPVAYQIYDAEGRSLLVNDAFREMFGSEPPPEYNVLNDEIAESRGVLSLVRRAFAGETVEVPTFWYDPRELTQVEVSEGRRVAVSTTIFPLFGEKHRVAYVVFALADATAEVEARERIEAERDRFRGLFENAMDGIVVLDDESRLKDANPAACEILGRSAAELEGRPLFDFAAPGADLHAVWSTLMVQGRLVGEIAIRHADGSLRDVEFQARSGFLPGRHLAIFRDISTRKRLEAELRASESNYREFFDRAGDGVLVLDPETGRVVDMNLNAVESTGWTLEEMRSLPLERIVSGEPGFTVEDMKRWIRRAASEGRQVFEWRARHRNGGVQWIEMDLQKATVAGETRLIAFMRRIDDRKKLAEQLRQAQKMEAVGRLAGGVAHDFNNLLTVISGYTSLLIDRVRGGDPLWDPLQEIHKAAERAASLTRRLLAFSRKSIVAPEPVDLNALIREMTGMLMRLIGEDLELRATLSPSPARVRADPSQLEQVIMNLVINARDAMPTGGHLLIETQVVELDESSTRAQPHSPAGRYVVLEISDTGVGMSEETRSHIFEPFFTTKGQGHGTGLGLATVYGIIKQNGGFVTVASEPGRGSTFRIHLPELAGAERPAAASPGPARIPAGTETILLVEDEDGIRQLGQLVLESSGFKVLSARHGREALELAKAHAGEIHLLLTDVVMPQMSGHQVAEALKRARPGIRVLYMSGYTDDAVVRYGVLHTEMAFLQKPFTPAALARKVRETLDRPREAAA